MDVEELIRAIKGRPLMFVEKARVDYICYLLKGYVAGSADKKLDVNEFFRAVFYQWVLKWAAENKGYKQHSFYWYRVLRDITDNEEEAVELFFELADKFFARYHEEGDFW